MKTLFALFLLDLEEGLWTGLSCTASWTITDRPSLAFFWASSWMLVLSNLGVLPRPPFVLLLSTNRLTQVSRSALVDAEGIGGRVRVCDLVSRCSHSMWSSLSCYTASRHLSSRDARTDSIFGCRGSLRPCGGAGDSGEARALSRLSSLDRMGTDLRVGRRRSRTRIEDSTRRALKKIGKDSSDKCLALDDLAKDMGCQCRRRVSSSTVPRTAIAPSGDDAGTLCVKLGN